MSSSPRKPEVISIQRPSLMPVCTGTDVALPCSTMKTDLPFCVLITAWGGTTNACGISRNPSDTWAKVPGLSAWSALGRSISISRLRVAGSSASVERVMVPVKDRAGNSVTSTEALVLPGTIQGLSSCGTLA